MELYLPRGSLSLAAERFDPTPLPFVDDPARWVSVRRRAHVTDQQKSVLESVRDHRYSAVPSAHDLGKSFTAGNLATWWIDQHPVGEAKVVTTAPTGDQVKGILWQEIYGAHADSGAPGKVNQVEWWCGQRRVAFGRKPADYNPAAFQGHHETYVLVIIDEACGVPKAIFDAVDALVTNEHSRCLAIGNPDDPTSHFAEICKPGSGWHVTHLDGLDSPAFTEEKHRTPPHVLDKLLSPLWVEERKLRWGEDSPLYVAKVRGRFPTDALDGVVRASDVAKCSIPLEYLPDDKRLRPIMGGLDVGAGSDKSVLIVAKGMRPELAFEDLSRASEVVVAKTMLAIKEHKITELKVDTIGWGWGVAGHLRDKIKDEGLTCEIVDVNVGESPQDSDRFPKLRDEIWWTIGREMCTDHAWDLSLVGDQALADLLAPRWAPDTRGRIKVEAKDETRARIKRSPDHGDALLLAYYKGKGGLNAYMRALKAGRQ